MYTENPEDYLQHRGGMLIKPVEITYNDRPSEIEHEKKMHEMKIEDIKVEAAIEEKRWKSCCFQLEPESSLFFGKLGISIVVIGLCGYQLITLKDCQYQSLYSSVLSSVITFWLSKK